MRIKQGFKLREIADTFIVVPVGEKVVEFNGLISLNETGAFLWRHLEQGNVEKQTLEDNLCINYGISPVIAKEDTEEFVSLLEHKGLIDHE